ncbi:MAG: endonuclease III domain-containing protein [Candidatus Gastranaerophilaceae bacterium]
MKEELELNEIIDEIFESLKFAKIKQSKFVRFMEQQDDPYVVLIACILSLRTNDVTTYPATMKMLQLASTPQEMMNVDEEELAETIYPVGFYKNKAKQIIALSKKIVDEYNGKVPNSIDELLKFDGVGRKTANLVMAKGFNEPAICVDVHVHRIFNRLGLVNTKTPEETEMKLREIIPEKYWIRLNTDFVTLGQNICKPTKPMCPFCPINYYCKTNPNPEE